MQTTRQGDLPGPVASAVEREANKDQNFDLLGPAEDQDPARRRVLRPCLPLWPRLPLRQHYDWVRSSYWVVGQLIGKNRWVHHNPHWSNHEWEADHHIVPSLHLRQWRQCLLRLRCSYICNIEIWLKVSKAILFLVTSLQPGVQAKNEYDRLWET